MYKERMKAQSGPGGGSKLALAGGRVAALAVLMLLIGIAIGYFSRPTIEARFADTPVPTANSEASLEQLRVEVQSLTRHYLGDENAPVTLIEFGDFQ